MAKALRRWDGRDYRRTRIIDNTQLASFMLRAAGVRSERQRGWGRWWAGLRQARARASPHHSAPGLAHTAPRAGAGDLAPRPPRADRKSAGGSRHAIWRRTGFHAPQVPVAPSEGVCAGNMTCRGRRPPPPLRGRCGLISVGVSSWQGQAVGNAPLPRAAVWRAPSVVPRVACPAPELPSTRLPSAHLRAHAGAVGEHRVFRLAGRRAQSETLCSELRQAWRIWSDKWGWSARPSPRWGGPAAVQIPSSTSRMMPRAVTAAR
jgi:hypothetical protein